jgi:hypothetical protein
MGFANFLLGLAWNHNPFLLSTFQVAEITGMNHCTQLVRCKNSSACSYGTSQIYTTYLFYVTDLHNFVNYVLVKLKNSCPKT